jgi:hypothetical protein
METSGQPTTDASASKKPEAGAGIRSEARDEAELIALEGGEIPEVAFHAGLAQLEALGTEANDAERRLLEAAVVERYETIILRDLIPENRNSASFRSPQRAWINWRRLSLFAQSIGRDVSHVRAKAAACLRRYLEVEAGETALGRMNPTVGLDDGRLGQFMNELGLVDEAVRSAARAVTGRMASAAGQG